MSRVEGGQKCLVTYPGVFNYLHRTLLLCSKVSFITAREIAISLTRQKLMPLIDEVRDTEALINTLFHSLSSFCKTRDDI